MNCTRCIFESRNRPAGQKGQDMKKYIIQFKDGYLKVSDTSKAKAKKQAIKLFPDAGEVLHIQQVAK